MPVHKSTGLSLLSFIVFAIILLMREETDLNEVKRLAQAFVYMEPEQVEECPFFIQHPVYDTILQIIDGKPFNLLEDINAFKKLQQKTVDSIFRKKTALGVLFMIRASYRLTFFKYCKNDLSEEDYSNLLMEAWLTEENPMSDVNVSMKELLSYFKKANKEIMMCSKDLAAYNTFPDKVTIYRGVKEPKLGMSWTLSKSKAEWFATRFSDTGYIFQAIANKSDILCYTNDRNEKEVILNPNLLTDITQNVI